VVQVVVRRNHTQEAVELLIEQRVNLAGNQLGDRHRGVCTLLETLCRPGGPNDTLFAAEAFKKSLPLLLVPVRCSCLHHILRTLCTLMSYTLFDKLVVITWILTTVSNCNSSSNLDCGLRHIDIIDSSGDPVPTCWPKQHAFCK
jgi:hypothetical protein